MIRSRRIGTIVQGSVCVCRANSTSHTTHSSSPCQSQEPGSRLAPGFPKRWWDKLWASFLTTSNDIRKPGENKTRKFVALHIRVIYQVDQDQYSSISFVIWDREWIRNMTSYRGTCANQLYTVQPGKWIGVPHPDPTWGIAKGRHTVLVQGSTSNLQPEVPVNTGLEKQGKVENNFRELQQRNQRVAIVPVWYPDARNELSDRFSHSWWIWGSGRILILKQRGLQL